jgi:BON domain
MITTMSTGNNSVQSPSEPKRIFALVGALVLAAALSACAVFPKSSNPTADSAITADVKSRFAQDAEFIHPAELYIQTVNGVVYLNGKVNTGLQRRRAEDIAREDGRVVKVVNDLYVTR